MLASPDRPHPASTAPTEPARPETDILPAFRELLARSIRAEQRALEGEIERIPAQLAELSRRFVALDRRLPAAARRLEELRTFPDLDAFAAAELERVRRVSGVRDARVEGTSLVVRTGPVAVHWGHAAYNLGTYRLWLDLAGDVRVESLDKLGPRPGWDHPHVQDGLPCLGNLRHGVLKLVAEYELALATQVLMDFLATYQPETAYTCIEGWPRLP